MYFFLTLDKPKIIYNVSYQGRIKLKNKYLDTFQDLLYYTWRQVGT